MEVEEEVGEGVAMKAPNAQLSAPISVLSQSQAGLFDAILML